MSEAKHTPGPWSVEPPSEMTPNIWIVSNGDPGIAKIEICDHDDHHGEHLTEEDFANASLIAAAPELLEALRYLVVEVSGMIGIEEQAFRDLLGNTNVNCLKQRWLNARTVIAKAEGREGADGNS